MSSSCWNRAATVQALLALAVLTALSQDVRQESPVFKSARRPNDSPQIRSADPTYEVLQTFLLIRKANAGDIVAQHELGVRYFLGRGVVADSVEAARWIGTAAGQNYLPARFSMGVLLYNGWGAEWNPFESYRQLSMCAAQGMAAGQYLFSLFFLDGLVVPRDYATARKWLAEAAQQGYSPAREALQELDSYLRRQNTEDSLARTGAPVPPLSSVPLFGGVEEDTADNQTLQSVIESAVGGADPDLRQSLGLVSSLEQSSGSLDSNSLAAVRRAADAGSPEALTLLGRCYERGISVPRDRVLAAEYYLRAMRMDSPRAPALLYTLMQDEEFLKTVKHRAGNDDGSALFVWASSIGFGYSSVLAASSMLITQEQAMGMFSRAASRFHVPSMIELGLIKLTGAVARQKEEALDLWRSAAARGSREAEVRLAMLALREADPAAVTAAVETVRYGLAEGSVLAQIALGYACESGTGVVRSLPEAIRLYRAAARRGSQDGYSALVRLHDRIRPADKEFRSQGSGG